MTIRRLLLAIGGACLAFIGFGVFSALQTPQIVRYSIPVPGLKTQIRLVQVSDSHASRFGMPPSRLRRVAAQINDLKPDVIVLTGDYIRGNPDDWSASETSAALAPFKALRAPLGVYAVLGNHDDRYNTAAALSQGPVRLLVGERVDVGPLLIVGADDLTGGSPAVEAMRSAIRKAPPNRAIIVIAHEPNFFPFLEKRPVVMIVGHTHGGQIRLPFIGIHIPDPYSAAHPRGIYRVGQQTMLVSSGLGTSIVPLRIGVPPEIVEITLLPAPFQPGKNSGTDK